MKNIKCLSCKFYYVRPSSQNYNFSLCTKFNTFSVIARQDNLLCGSTYKNYENKAYENKEPENKAVDIKPIENKKDEYKYDTSYDYIMSQIHI
jgi:hypothetical protein